MNVPHDCSNAMEPALAERLAGLSPAKRAFIERQLQRARSPQDGSAIPVRDDTGPAPLSFSQEHLWNLEQSAPGLSTYNVPRAMRIAGRLDIEAVRAALRALVVRHEALRTTIECVDGEPRAIVLPPREPLLAIVDLRGCADDERESELQRVLREAVRAPFDLTCDVLIRASLVTLAIDDHALALVWHHMASDEASAAILFGDLTAIYNGLLAGKPATSRAATLRYTDFAAWQRAHWRGERLDAFVLEWAQRLKAEPQCMELPLDRPRPAHPSFAGERRVYELSAPLAQAAVDLASSQGTTPFVVLLAAFKALLHRYTGQSSICVGSVFTGRRHSQLDGVLGYFSNVLPLRSHFADDTTVLQLLENVREEYLFGLDHSDLPFEQLVAEIGERCPGQHVATFSTIFAMASDGPTVPALSNLALTPIAIDRGVAKLDLMVGATVSHAGLKLSVEYRTQLFDGSTIDRMFENFATLLDGIVRDPLQLVSRLPLLGETEQRLIAERNRTGSAYRGEATLDGLIAEQVARTPEAIAIECVDADGAIARLSYRELAQRAELLAKYLRTLGIGPDVGVGVCLERSLDLIVALFGVLKSGGYYVPLDPQYPTDRLAFMISDARVPVLLTNDRSIHAIRTPLTNGAAPSITRLDAQWTEIATAQPTRLDPQPDRSPRTLAYTIYTSGSTGRPKGVMIPHGSVVNYLRWMQHEYPLQPGDGVFQRAPVSFDASVWELFAPLIAGGRLVLAPANAHLDPIEILDALERHDVVVAQFVPSQMQMILDGAGAEAARILGRLRRLFLGGERLPPELLDRIFSACPTLPVTNLYGPTEATVYATHSRFDGTTWEKGSIVPLGRPVDNVTVYLVDRAGELIPTGVAGELCIGGCGLARGYHDRVELTAERFVPDRFGPNPEGRIYRTGDLARYRANGSLEYLGRFDTQVKLRGFRVELGEIENALAATPEVASAVVMLRHDDEGALIAYCIATPEASAIEHATLAATLREKLARTLPDFMIPGSFIWLDAWPLNANGKLDRGLLARRPIVEEPVVSVLVPARTSSERLIADIWSSVLRREHIGVLDNFFVLGGHSLSAMRVLARISATIGRRISLREFYEAPTVADLAARLNMDSHTDSKALERIPRRLSNDPLPLTPAQETLWLLQLGTSDAGAYNVRVGWRLHGALDVCMLQRALDALVVRHPVLRSTFASTDGEPQQFVHDSGNADFTFVDLTDRTVNDRVLDAAGRMQEFGRRAFDLSHDGLLRALLIKMGDEEHLLLLVSHHIVVDGSSVGVLTRELGTLYEAFATGGLPELPPLPLDFGDFVAWETGRKASGQFDALIAFWREQLLGASLTLALPIDHPKVCALRFEGAHIMVVFPQQLLNDLRRLAQQRKITLFALLLAAYAALLQRYTAQEDIVIGSPVEGRGSADLEGVVGYFVNMLPLRARFAGDPTFAEVAHRMREITLGALEHQALPIDLLRRELHGLANDGDGLFSTSFMFSAADNASMNLGPLTVSPVSFETGSAKFDLALSMSEQPEGLRASFEYRADIFESVTIRGFASSLQALLERIVADPDQRISVLPMASEPDRQRLALMLNVTSTDFTSDRTLHELFAEQAARRPEAVAVVCNAESMSYEELELRVSLLAYKLQQLGVGPEKAVGICVDRSLTLVVSILAVLAAGGYYVPLDPSYPSERLKWIIEDASPAVIIVSRSVAERVPSMSVALVFADELDITSEPVAPLKSGAGPDNLAYVIYTSGSTGRPKGVMITHRNVTRLLSATHADFGFDENDVWSLFHSYAFDFSVWEIWGALAFGGRLVVVPYLVSRSPEEFRSLLRHEGVTVLNQTPSAFRELMRVDEGKPELLSALRWVIFGGEALEPSRLAPWFARYGEANPRLVNMYGITETTVHVTYRALRASDIHAATRSPIGRAIADLCIYVLDAAGQPVPVGVPGEMYVGGAGVARGYLNRPDLTAERFVPNPHEKGGILYRTGDRARRRSNGELEFLGRVDDQVKLRGFRIELGEIESALLQIPAIADAVVVLRENDMVGAQLVAYYVLLPAAQTGPTFAAELRARLSALLPDYMVPNDYVDLPALPLNSNGKIDRKALPAPAGALLHSCITPYVAPRTPMESEVARLFERVLNVDRVGATDDFFARGGHSLLAIRLINSAGERFGISIPLAAIFEARTVAKISTAIEQLLHDALGAAVGGADEALLAELDGLSDDEAMALLGRNDVRAGLTT